VPLAPLARWEVSAGRDVGLYRIAPLASEPPSVGRDVNGWTDLSECWVREDGAWTFRGAWGRGKELPPPAGGPPPPGWLAAGLPQGVGVLLGRLAAGDPTSFVRLTGF
jgi:hypothetical protein